MIGGILKASSHIFRNLVISKITKNTFPSTLMRTKMFYAPFSEEKDLLISRINQGLVQEDPNNVLAEVDKLDMEQKQEALIHLYMGIFKGRLNPQILSLPSFSSLINQFDTKPLYVRILGLKFQNLASDFLVKVRSKQLKKQEASKYLLEMDDLRNRGLAAAHKFSDIESFVMQLPFVRLQMATQINYITYMKEGQERILGLIEAMEFFESNTLSNLQKTLEEITKFVKEQKSSQNNNFNRLFMSIALVFCQNTLQFFETANNIFSYSGKKLFFNENLTSFMKISELAVSAWQRAQDLHPTASYMIHLKKKRLVGEYYLEKMAMREEKKSEEDFKKLKEKFEQKFEDLYCDLRDKYLQKTQNIPQIVAIHMELIGFMSQVLEELQLQPEEMEKRFKEEKQVICSLISKQVLRKKFEIYLDSYIKRYMQEREKRKLLLFDDRL